MGTKKDQCRGKLRSSHYAILKWKLREQTGPSLIHSLREDLSFASRNIYLRLWQTLYIFCFSVLLSTPALLPETTCFLIEH